MTVILDVDMAGNEWKNGETFISVAVMAIDKDAIQNDDCDISLNYASRAPKDSLSLSYEFLEKGIPISGTVLNSNNDPEPYSEVRISTANGDLLIGRTDSAGRFYTDQLLHVDSTEIIVNAQNLKKEKLSIEIDAFDPGYHFILSDSIAIKGNVVQKKRNTSIRRENKMRSCLKGLW